MSRVKYLVVLLVLGILMAVPIIALAAQPAQSPLTIQLAPLNDSGQSGTAVLTDMGNGQIKVDVTVSGEPAGASEPEHIHTGQCGPTLGGVVYPLTNLENGTSTTMITATLASLMDGNHAINGHKSKAEIQTYVYCGNIPAAAAAASTTVTATTSAPAATPAATAAAPSTAPSTGGNPYGIVLVAFVAGLIVLASGLVIRRFARQ